MAGSALLGGGPVLSSGERSLASRATRRALANGTLSQSQLERTIARLQACLGQLTNEQRRVLSLRAGLGPRPALSRTQVADRVGRSVAQTRRIERRALHRLGALDGAGMCTTGAVAVTPLSLLTGGLLGEAGGESVADSSPAGFGVKGVSDAGGGGDGSGDGGGLALPPPIGDGADWTLLILLGLAAMLALLVRREARRR